MSSHLITIDVSSRKYRTQKATLRYSPYFANLLDRWDDCNDRQADGSYFVDADPDVFQHVLDFLRRPSRFPLFWSKEKGFDYALYNKLEAEADYFLVHDLRDWIREKKYLEAVKTVVNVKVLFEDEARGYKDRGYTTFEADAEVQSFFGSFSGKKRFRNPCQSHYDRNEVVRGCSWCTERLRDHGPQYDDPAKNLIVVTKKTVFDETVCVNESVS